jgi:RNA polymerase sigma-70 factor (ECF subfamily)
MSNEELLIGLMVQYQAGGMEAFEDFYRVVKSALYKFLIVKSLDRQLAEDLLQETFLQIHRSRKTYIPGRPVMPWIFSIAHHVYLSDRRSRLKRIKREEALESRLEDIPIPPDIEAGAEIGGLRNALASLPREQRESILLHHYWGFSFREIGKTLGIRTGTAKLRAHRGLLKMREFLKIQGVTGNNSDVNITV